MGMLSLCQMFDILSLKNQSLYPHSYHVSINLMHIDAEMLLHGQPDLGFRIFWDILYNEGQYNEFETSSYKISKEYPN